MSAPRVLLVRFSAIGDCVMVTPVATAVRRKYPDAHLVWAVEDRCETVLETQTLLTRAHVFPRTKWKAARWSPETWREQILAYTSLRPERFDWGIDFQGHSKTALLLRLARVGKAIAAPGTDPIARALNPQTKLKWKAMHRVEGNMGLLREFEEFDREVVFTLPQLEEETAKVREMLPSGRIATIATGAGADNKVYPAAQWVEVAAGLQAQGLQVVWVGGPRDPEPIAPGTVSLVGKLTLRETMAALAASEVHAAGDTGSGHLCAALGVPVVSVFGPMDPVVYRPYTDHGRVLNRDGIPDHVRPDEVVKAAMELVHERSTAISD